MKELAEKIARVEKTASEKKGGFSLFALFLREDSPNKWDLVVSAPWASKTDEALRFMVAEVKEHLEPKDVIDLSRIIVVDSNSLPVRAINEAIAIEHGRAEVSNGEFFGMPMRHAFIITSKSAPTRKPDLKKRRRTAPKKGLRS